MSNELEMGEERHPKKRRKLLFFIIFLVLLLIAGGGAWYFLDGKLPFMGGDDSATTTTDMSSNAKARTQPIGNVVPLPAFTVNLADPLGRRVLHINISLEVAGGNVIEELRRQEPRVRDAIILLLSSKSYGDIATADSKLILKGEVTSRVNQLLGDQKVVQTYITDMLVR